MIMMTRKTTEIFVEAVILPTTVVGAKPSHVSESAELRTPRTKTATKV